MYAREDLLSGKKKDQKLTLIFFKAFPNLYAIRGTMHRDTLQVPLQEPWFKEKNCKHIKKHFMNTHS